MERYTNASRHCQKRTLRSSKFSSLNTTVRKYSVEKPKFEDDDDESTFDDIFGKSLEKPGGDSNG